jgi:hypothetical protein
MMIGHEHHDKHNALRKRKKSSSAPQDRQRQVMFRQMAAQREEEEDLMNNLAQLQNGYLNEMIRTYGTILGLLSVVAIVGVWYVHPDLLFGSRGERLPNRNLITLYPSNLAIQKSLPRFFRSYGKSAVHEDKLGMFVVCDEGFNLFDVTYVFYNDNRILCLTLAYIGYISIYSCCMLL